MTAASAGPVCRECGSSRRLNGDGVCRHRHGCEHRVFQREERERRVLAEVEAILSPRPSVWEVSLECGCPLCASFRR